MKIELIDTGYFYADGGAMFGAIPKTAWSRRYPSNETNGCVLAMRSALITTDEGKVILVDTGAGTKQLKKLGYYQFFNLSDLHAELQKRGIRVEQVTDVVLTHLHFDHCGYATLEVAGNQELAIAFPQATHWVSQAQWNNFQHPNPLEKDSYFPENMEAIEKNGLLRLVTTETTLSSSVTLKLFDGHTPGQLVPYISTPERTFVFAGDVIPLVASLSPEWISAYDTYPVISYIEKVRLLEEAVAQQQAIIYCHDAYTYCTTVKRVNGFYKKEQTVLL